VILSFSAMLLAFLSGLILLQLRDSTRSRQVNAAAGAVLTRHNEIAQIEKTMMELAAMFEDMAQLVESQEPVVQRTEENAVQTAEDVKRGNVEIDKANEHARRRNRLKWWCLLVVVRIRALQIQ
jgi:syntaxin 1B/2/3